MGFIQAIRDIGSLEGDEGLDAYLKLPAEKEGKAVRVFLEVEDPEAEMLEVKGVARVDLADLKLEPEMKRKYLYRDRVGANVTWGFTPLFKIGKPKSTLDKNREDWVGPSGNWREETHSHFHKLRYRVLDDYEAEGTLSPGSADRIMTDLENWLGRILESLQPKQSHIILFGVVRDEQFLYPGEVPAFVSYFRKKLSQSLAGSSARLKACAVCQRPASGLVSLSSVFKFATADKVSFLPGLDKGEKERVFTVCQDCLRKLSAGRERVERTLTYNDVVPGLRLWVIPEAAGPDGGSAVKRAVEQLERVTQSEELATPGERSERRYFSAMAREGSSLVYHFLFWEKNNAQELVHLMVEDVPPERLAFLERTWERVMKTVMGEAVRKGLNLDWALKSLYATLSRLAGKSDSDKLVFRDFTLKTLGKLLKGETLPIRTFKNMVTSRAARLVYESNNWSDVASTLLYAQVWVEFMTAVNQGGRKNEFRPVRAVS